MNAGAVKDLLRMIIKNSPKITRSLRWLQFQRILKYHEYCKSLTALAITRLLICIDWENYEGSR